MGRVTGAYFGHIFGRKFFFRLFRGLLAMHTYPGVMKGAEEGIVTRIDLIKSLSRLHYGLSLAKGWGGFMYHYEN